MPLLGAFMFALYGLLTRLVARVDSAETSFFWTGIAGAVAITADRALLVDADARAGRTGRGWACSA